MTVKRLSQSWITKKTFDSFNTEARIDSYGLQQCKKKIVNTFDLKVKKC